MRRVSLLRRETCFVIEKEFVSVVNAFNLNTQLYITIALLEHVD